MVQLSLMFHGKHKAEGKSAGKATQEAKMRDYPRVSCPLKTSCSCNEPKTSSEE